VRCWGKDGGGRGRGCQWVAGGERRSRRGRRGRGKWRSVERRRCDRREDRRWDRVGRWRAKRYDGAKRSKREALRRVLGRRASKKGKPSRRCAAAVGVERLHHHRNTPRATSAPRRSVNAGRVERMYSAVAARRPGGHGQQIALARRPTARADGERQRWRRRQRCRRPCGSVLQLEAHGGLHGVGGHALRIVERRREGQLC